MTRFLVGTTSVHTTAAACDYLEPRVGADDTVLLLTVDDDTIDGRDAGDAANVARTRLFEPTIETHSADGDVVTELLQVAENEEIDEILVGQHRGDPEAAGDPPGSTVRRLLGEATRPVVVIPV